MALRTPLVRVLVMVATFAAVWLVAAPARAVVDAPWCDPHAASAFAPVPQLQSPEVSLDVDEVGSCAELMADRGVVGLSRGSAAKVEQLSSSREPALAPAPLIVPPASQVDVVAYGVVVLGARAGHLARVDRPPRA